jgi:hypothetical protein
MSFFFPFDALASQKNNILIQVKENNTLLVG